MPAVTFVKSTAITLLDATPARLPDATVFGGQTRYATYTFAGSALSTVVRMIRCKKGEVVLGGQVYWEAMGATTQITVGTVDSTSRFMTSAPTATATSSGVLGLSAASTGRFNVLAGIGYEFTAEGDIVIATADVAMTGTASMIVHIGHPGHN